MVKDLPPLMAKLKGLKDVLTEEEIDAILGEIYSGNTQEIEFETFLRVFFGFQFVICNLVFGRNVRIYRIYLKCSTFLNGYYEL